MNISMVKVNGLPMVSSKEISDKFEKQHRQILDSIRAILKNEPEFGGANFYPSSYISEQNKKLDCFNITRDGFSMVAMGMIGKPAMKWKIKYINAFNAMEQKILKSQGDLTWSQARQQIKGVRRSITDTIKEFVEYATKQGSTSATRYYSNITKMEYKALQLTESFKKSKDEKCNFRDALNLMDISFLSAAEWVARNAIEEGMQRELPYKEIYQLSKERVIAYADTVNIRRIGLTDEQN